MRDTHTRRRRCGAVTTKEQQAGRPVLQVHARTHARDRDKKAGNKWLTSPEIEKGVEQRIWWRLKENTGARSSKLVSCFRSLLLGLGWEYSSHAIAP